MSSGTDLGLAVVVTDGWTDVTVGFEVAAEVVVVFLLVTAGFFVTEVFLVTTVFSVCSGTSSFFEVVGWLFDVDTEDVVTLCVAVGETEAVCESVAADVVREVVTGAVSAELSAACVLLSSEVCSAELPGVSASELLLPAQLQKQSAAIAKDIKKDNSLFIKLTLGKINYDRQKVCHSYSIKPFFPDVNSFAHFRHYQHNSDIFF